MESTKPYLIRAIHQWCVDNGFTPYLAVAVDETTRVPVEFVRDGEIVLNVGLEATHQLDLGNDAILFQARFGGRAFPVRVPVERVQAIYARENGQGMAFEVTTAPAGVVAPVAVDTPALGDTPNTGSDKPGSGGDKPGGGRAHLTRIK